MLGGGRLVAEILDKHQRAVGRRCNADSDVRVVSVQNVVTMLGTVIERIVGFGLATAHGDILACIGKTATIRMHAVKRRATVRRLVIEIVVLRHICRMLECGRIKTSIQCKRS